MGVCVCARVYARVCVVTISGGRTGGAEVEEQRQVSPAGQTGVGLAEFIEEGVRAGFEGGEACGGGVLQQAGAQGDGLGRGARLKHLGW